MNQRHRRVLSRRLRHRSRSVAASVALAVTAAVAAWTGFESARAALGLPPVLVSPSGLVRLADAGGPGIVGAAACLVVLGIVALGIAVAPGRRGRRELADARSLVIVEDEVLASGLSRAVASAARVDDDQVRTAVSRRRSVSRVRPTTGYRPDADRARAAAADLIARAAPVPAPRSRVLIESEGVPA